MIDDESTVNGLASTDVPVVPVDDVTNATAESLTEVTLSAEQPPLYTEFDATRVSEDKNDRSDGEGSDQSYDDRENASSGSQPRHSYETHTNLKVQTLLDLVDQIPTVVDPTNLEAEQLKPDRQLIAQVADAVYEVQALESGPPPECAEELARAESWLSSFGETAREHKTHEIHLAFIHKPNVGSNVSKPVQVLSIPLDHETKTLEAFQRRIGRLAKFKTEHDESDQGSGGGCASWFRKTEPKKGSVDPTLHRLVRVYSRDAPGVLLGGLDMAVRFFPSSPSNFVFNKYDQDHEGTLSRTEFAAFVHDLSLAGGNLSRLEDNIRNPRRNFLGSLFGLTAPEIDLLSYVGMNHSLSMWAFKPDPSARLEASGAERLLNCINLLLWSLAINCAGPYYATWYNEINHGPDLDPVHVLVIVVLLDTIGQVLINLFFKLRHNSTVKRFLFVSPDVIIPEYDCSCAPPLRSIRTSMERCTKTSFRCMYEYACVRLPLAVAAIVMIMMLFTFIRYQLWEYAGSLLKTIPSARTLEAFKLATMWGFRTQFGAVHGKLDESSDSVAKEVSAGILSRSSLLEKLLPASQPRESPYPLEALISMHDKDHGCLQRALDDAVLAKNVDAVEDVIRAAEKIVSSEIAHQQAKGETHLTVSHYLKHILQEAEEAKRAITVDDVKKQFGAIVPVWPPVGQVVPEDSNKARKFITRMESTLDGEEQETISEVSDNCCGLAHFCSERVFCCLSNSQSTLQPDSVSADHGPCGSHLPSCSERLCCCFKQGAGEQTNLLASGSSSGVEMTTNRKGNGTFERIPSSADDEESSRVKSGFFLMHRDGKWPDGLPDTAFEHNPLSFTNELEVELSLSSDGFENLQYAEEAADPTLELSKEEWADISPMLSASIIYAFPLNPLKELVHNLNHFDEMYKAALDADASHQRLTPRDRYFLNTSKAEIQAQIDQVLKLGGKSVGCFGK